MFDKLKDLREFFRHSKTKIDGFIFSLHYKPTCGILVAMSLIIITNWFFKTQINCFFSKSDIKNFLEVAQDYCLLHSPFVVYGPEDAKHGKPVHPGVRQVFEEDTTKYQLYYQWVPFMCMVQAIIFYFPRYLWCWCERGRVKIVTEFCEDCMISDEETTNKKKIVVDHIMKCMGKNKIYGYGYLLCEVLNFVNVVGQAYITDAFLGYEFSTYGFEVFSFMRMNPADRTDPMARIFPRIAKCIFNMHGPSGSIEYRDGICVLPSNVLYEKVYIWMWCWFAFLSILSGLNLFDMMITVVSRYYRAVQLHWRSPFTSFRKIRFLCKEFGIGDWLFISLLGKNLNPSMYRDIIEDLCLNLEMQKNNGRRDYSSRFNDNTTENDTELSANRYGGRPPGNDNNIGSNRFGRSAAITVSAVTRNENEIVNICRSYR